jgi:hypothetical protein
MQRTRNKDTYKYYQAILTYKVEVKANITKMKHIVETTKVSALRKMVEENRIDDVRS